MIGQQALAVFVRQLSTLVRARLPLVRAFEVLARQEKNVVFRDILVDLADSVRSGGTFSDALRRHPRIFDRLFVSMIKAGEAAGALVPVLERLALFAEKSVRIKGRVKSALTYPVIILLVAFGIVAGLMVFVIPRFQGIFSGLLKGQPLPVLTQSVMSVSFFVRDNATLCAMGLVLGYSVVGFARRTAFGARVFDNSILRAPLFGDLFLKVAVSRFSRTLGTLLSSGVPILPALIITRETAGNLRVGAALALVHDQVRAGNGLAQTLDSTGIFPPMVTSMIEVGEETGSLPELLNRVADTYDEEVDTAVASLTTVIEPLMIVIMAVVVGTVVIALFLPIIRIIQVLS